MKVKDIRIGQKVLDSEGGVHQIDAVFSDGRAIDLEGNTLRAEEVGPVAREPHIVTHDDGTVSLRLEVEQGFFKADIEPAGEFGRNAAYLGFQPKGTDTGFDLFSIQDDPEYGDPKKDIRVIRWGEPWSLGAESDRTLSHEDWE